MAQELSMMVGLLCCGIIWGERAGELMQVKEIIKKEQDNSFLLFQRNAIEAGLCIFGKESPIQRTKTISKLTRIK